MTQATTADAHVPARRDHTVTLTTAQAVVRYLAAQTSVRDGRRQRLIPAMLGIFGHGNVAGIGQALDEYQAELPFVQGRNEQSLVHIASGVREGEPPHRHARGDRLDRPGRREHDHRRRAGDGQPAARAAVPRRHLRHAPAGPGAAAARASHRRRRERQRLLPPGGALLRSHHPPRAAADRAARGDARPHQPERGGRGGDRPAAGHPDRGLRLPGRVLRAAGLDDRPPRAASRRRRGGRRADRRRPSSR